MSSATSLQTAGAVKRQIPERRISLYILGFILIFSALVRFEAIEKKPIWQDEAHSISSASVHSVAPTENTRKSDYAEITGISHPADYTKFLALDNGTPDFPGVMRAAGHLNPPLYYLILHEWVLLVGTSDFATRSLSVVCSLLTIIFLWQLASLVRAGKFGGSAACLLYGLSPLAIHTAVEAKSYSLVCLASTAMCLLTVKICTQGKHHVSLPYLWASIGMLSLFLHPYMIFIFGPCTLWLLLFGAAKVRYIAAFAFASSLGALTISYKSAFTENLQNSWLSGFPTGLEAAMSPFKSLLCYFDGGGQLSETVHRILYLPLAIATIATAAIIWLSSKRDELSRSSMILLLLCVGCALAGPIAYDLLRNMHTCTIPRYSLSGLPLAFVMVGWLLQRIPNWLRCASICLVAGVWLTGWQWVFSDETTMLRQTFEKTLTAQDAVVLVGEAANNLSLVRYLPRNCNLIACGRDFGRQNPEDLVKMLSKFDHAFVCFGRDNTPVEKTFSKYSQSSVLPTLPPQNIGDVRVYQFHSAK